MLEIGPYHKPCKQCGCMERVFINGIVKECPNCKSIRCRRNSKVYKQVHKEEAQEYQRQYRETYREEKNRKERERRLRYKQDCLAYLGRCCQHCGTTDISVLEFHHLNPAEKEFNVGDLRKPLEKAKEELDKCIILCRECHLAEHKRLLSLVSQLYQTPQNKPPVLLSQTQGVVR